MKIRIKDQSIRIRCTQTEVKTIFEHGSFSCKTKFGPGENAELQTIINTSGDTELRAGFGSGIITISIPQKAVENWYKTELVGLDNFENKAENELGILIEKDFQCLVPRDNGDDEDTHVNPLAGKTC